jgi:hypothetical protein
VDCEARQPCELDRSSGCLTRELRKTLLVRRTRFEVELSSVTMSESPSALR